MKVFVLGAGPDGLLAAHAAALRGHEVSIIASSPKKEEIIGNPLLMNPIPQVADGDPLRLCSLREGTCGDIRRKANVSGSFPLTPRDHNPPGDDNDRVLFSAWSLRDAYDKLWDKFSPYLGLNEHMNAEFVRSILSSDADVVISALPAPVICHEPSHSFPCDEVLRAEAKDFIRGLLTRYIPAGYDGAFTFTSDKDVSWFGASIVGGKTDIMWPKTARPCYVPHDDRRVIKHPALTTCDCFKSVIKVGTHGRWQSKGFLVDNVFADMLFILEDFERKIPSEQSRTS